jgi:hypothetical protein
LIPQPEKKRIYLIYEYSIASIGLIVKVEGENPGEDEERETIWQ